MMALTSEEWAILIMIIVLFICILYARATKKIKNQKHRNKVAVKLYNSAMNAQKDAVGGITKRQRNIQGANVNQHITPLDLQDPSRLFVQTSLAEITHRDYLLENEFLNIDG